MRIILICTFFLIAPFSTFYAKAQSGKIVIDSLYSPTLEKFSKYSVYLPSSYQMDSNKNHSAIYMLHGYGGDHMSWIKQGNAAFIMDSLLNAQKINETILIMPEGNNSYFINNFNGSFKYEDFFFNEFIPHIENVLFSKAHNPGRTILGLSMGGFGALVFSLKHPGLFDYCIALSASVRPPETFANLSQTRYQQLFGQVFCDSLRGMDRITRHWKDNSPYFIIDSLFFGHNNLPDIYLDCGSEDYLAKSNQALHKHLEKHSIPHVYIVRKGGHDWNYWKAGLINGLLFIETKRGQTVQNKH